MATTPRKTTAKKAGDGSQPQLKSLTNTEELIVEFARTAGAGGGSFQDDVDETRDVATLDRKIKFKRKNSTATQNLYAQIFYKPGTGPEVEIPPGVLPGSLKHLRIVLSQSEIHTNSKAPRGSKKK